MKTKQELENIKERLEKLSTELHELTDEELEQVTGGTTIDEFKAKIEANTESKVGLEFRNDSSLDFEYKFSELSAKAEFESRAEFMQ